MQTILRTDGEGGALPVDSSGSGWGAFPLAVASARLDNLTGGPLGLGVELDPVTK